MNKIITILLVVIIVFFACCLNWGNYSALAVDIDNGAKIFQANCAGCHAKGGNIVRRGKNLKLKTLRKNKLDNLEAIATLVTGGKNNMPAYGDLAKRGGLKPNRLTPKEIEDVSVYVLKQAKQGW